MTNEITVPVESPKLNRIIIPAYGGKDSYRLSIGTDLLEVGGIINVTCAVVTPGVVEGTQVIPLPFSNLLDCHCVAMNVRDVASAVNREGAFISIENGNLKIYAHASANKNLTIPVKWMAKGVI